MIGGLVIGWVLFFKVWRDSLRCSILFLVVRLGR